ncbi:hypothetical protein [Flavobacterium sp. ASV13]|uniref:hypothetical protein n=1 Tax=Flavobacterium sp. ASV13 TaxID=1506583 RepID=UPI00055673AD|nr:hypothetical protein [Flavobacterium sp. ASV13]
MKIALAQYTSADIRKETNFISDFSNDLKEWSSEKKYGKDLIELVIGVICVSQSFEAFFKPGKPKYIKEKKGVKSTYTKQEYDIEKCLTYDIKLDFETFKKFSEIEAKKHLSLEILKSLDIIVTMKTKIKDFDFLAFRKDLEDYFKENGLI